MVVHPKSMRFACRDHHAQQPGRQIVPSNGPSLEGEYRTTPGCCCCRRGDSYLRCACQPRKAPKHSCKQNPTVQGGQLRQCQHSGGNRLPYSSVAAARERYMCSVRVPSEAVVCSSGGCIAYGSGRYLQTRETGRVGPEKRGTEGERGDEYNDNEEHYSSICEHEPVKKQARKKYLPHLLAWSCR